MGGISGVVSDGSSPLLGVPAPVADGRLTAQPNDAPLVDQNGGLLWFRATKISGIAAPASSAVAWGRDARQDYSDIISTPTVPPAANAPSADVERAYVGQIGPLFLYSDGVRQRGEMGMIDPAATPRFVTQARPLTLYAYIFHRPGGGEIAPFAQYGGSQIYARANWRPFAGPLGRRTSLYARASRDLTRDGRVESALGISITPLAQFPVTAHAERRFRPSQPDATAAFISSGGTAAIARSDVRLDWDGQAGVVASDQGDTAAFFDGQTRVTAPIGSDQIGAIRGGAMVATGGQRGAARLDVGPVVTLDTGAVQGQIGWRFRIAGDAEPKSGPAVTISLGF